MNGEMIEAKTRHVDWSEVDVDTFIRLCEFAYFRKYTPPPFRLIKGRIPPEATKAIKKKVKRSRRRSGGITLSWQKRFPEISPQPEVLRPRELVHRIRNFKRYRLIPIT